jgi:hypothetical protein
MRAPFKFVGAPGRASGKLKPSIQSPSALLRLSTQPTSATQLNPAAQTIRLGNVKSSPSKSSTEKWDFPHVQAKLPLPPKFFDDQLPRLRPQNRDFLPSPINAPTTLPPELIAPKEVKNSEFNSIAKRLYYTAKSYYQFYKTGLKQFNQNRKIRTIIKNELYLNLKHIKIPGSGNLAMVRSEFQMMIRTKRDWRKMPRKKRY